MKKNIKPKFNLFKFIFCIFICQLAGILGSIFTFSTVKTWYINELVKPSFNPPSWLFGPVWTTLFFLIGWALYLVWTKKNNLFWFWIQLILNILWSILFFGLKNPWLAFTEIIILWIAILKTILEFKKYNKTASLLLLPYLAWVSFAAFLNLSIARLN